MLENMQVRHLSAGTQQVYLQHISRFARYCGRSPAVLGSEEIRAYQPYLMKERQLTSSTLVIVVAALRFLSLVTRAYVSPRCPLTSPRTRSTGTCCRFISPTASSRTRWKAT